MKPYQWLTLSLLFYLVVPVSGTAQTREDRWMAGLGAIFFDYRGPVTGEYIQFGKFDPGVQFSTHTWLAGLMNLSVNSALAPSVKYPVDDTTFSSTLVVDVNTALQFKLLNNGKVLKESFFFAPYIALGAGFNFRDSATSFYLPVGLGMRFRLSRGASIQIESMYKYTPGKYRSYLTHSAGFVFRLPTKTKNPPPPKEPPTDPRITAKRADRDKDGIPDTEDQCPDVPGLIQLQGCPQAAEPKPEKVAPPPEPKPAPVEKSKPVPPPVTPPVTQKPLPVSEFERPVKEIEREDKEFLVTAMHNVQFETGSDILTEDSYQTLDAIAGILEKYPDYRLIVAGHTDNTGNVGENQVLSVQRAFRVKYYLVNQKGIRLSRIESNGFGADKPMADNANAEGRMLNRRVEFELVR